MLCLYFLQWECSGVVVNGGTVDENSLNASDLHLSGVHFCVFSVSVAKH